MELLLIRIFFAETYTIGKLYIDGIYFCDVLEDKVRELNDFNNDGDFIDNGEGKIYGQTAIPYGRNQIILVYWAKHGKEYPQLQKVHGYTGIFIHSGISPAHTEGCLLLGENKIKGGLVNSTMYVNELTEMIRKVIKSGKQVFITIKKK